MLILLIMHVNSLDSPADRRDEDADQVFDVAPHDDVFRVVIAYEDLAAGRQAMRLVSTLANDHQGDFTFMPRLWRFDLLEDPDWRGVAAAEAASTDLLIISTGSASDLPTAIRSWIKSCLARKLDHSGALVALLGTAGRKEHAGSSDVQFLRNSAREAGLEFFAASPHCEEIASIESIQFRAETVTPTLDAILNPYTPNRHWGINE